MPVRRPSTEAESGWAVAAGDQVLGSSLADRHTNRRWGTAGVSSVDAEIGLSTAEIHICRIRKLLWG